MLVKKVHGELSPVQKCHVATGEDWGEFSPEEEAAAETTWNTLGLMVTPIPCPCATGREKVAELGPREGGGRCF